MYNNQSYFKMLLVPAVVTGVILLIPLIAMQFSDGVDWSLIDFVAAGILLFGTGAAYKLISSRVSNVYYKIAVAAACVSCLFLVWANLAVGIVGSEDNPINIIYLAMPLVAFLAAVTVKFRAAPMSYIMFGMASVQALSAVIILISAGMNNAEFNTNNIIIFTGIHGFFIVQFVFSGLMFRRAGKEINNSGNSKNNQKFSSRKD